MKHIRLTRDQSRDQTRQRLLDAGEAVFTKKGFTAASVEDIAAAAGYTRGAFYSNFGSKTALFLEILKRDHDQIMARLRSIFDDESSRVHMEERLMQYYSECYRENKCFLLWVDARLQASRDAKFRVQFNAFINEVLEATTAYIVAFSEKAGTPMTMPPAQLALGLTALIEGMMSYYSSDPQRFSGEAEAVLSKFFYRVVLGAEPAPKTDS
jgi:AcrR family transcriptional regulator